MTRALPITVAGAAVLALATSASAQNDRWSRDFNRSGLQGLGINDITVFRGEPYAIGEVGAGRGAFVDHVGRWDGAQWRSLPGTFVQSAQYPYSEWVNCGIVFQNELIVGGHFNSVGSTTAWHVARWNGITWSSFGSGLIGFGEVQALAVYNGELYAGGSFNTNSGIDGMARWNGSAWVPVGGAVTFSSDGVMTLRVASDNTLWAGGEFSAIGGVAAANVARWNGTTWQALGPGLPGGQAWALAEWQGRMVVAGGFDLGNNVRGVAAWNGSAFGSLGSSGNDGLNGVGLSLHPTATHLYVGGDFTFAGGTPTRAIARFDGNGWESLGGVGGGSGFPLVTGFADHQGRIAVVGRYERVGGETGSPATRCSNAATWDPAVGGPRGWAPLGPGLGSVETVQAMVPWRGGYAVAGSGDLADANLTWFDGRSFRRLAQFDQPVAGLGTWQGDLIVSGAFNYRDGQPTTRCLRFDGQVWTPMGNVQAQDFVEYQGALHASAGGISRWNGTAWQQVGFPLAESHGLAVFQGRLFVAGLRSFFQTDGLFAWDGATMVGFANGPTQHTRALLARGNELWVGGDFTQCGTQAIARLARFDGTGFRQIGAGIAGVQGVGVWSLAELDGRVYIGGSFNQQAGFATDSIVAWNGTAFAPLGSGLDGVPMRIVPEASTGYLYCVGSIQSAAGRPSTGGVPSAGMARYRTRDDWADLGLTLAGSQGPARLTGHGVVQDGGLFGLLVTGLPAATFGVQVVSLQRIDLPLFGGTLVPGWDAIVGFTASPIGAHDLAVPVDVALPANMPVFAQTWYLDSMLARGVSASNAVTAMSR